MAPCSRAALRLLTSVLLLSSLASSAALPARYGEVLARRADRQLDVPVTLNSGKDPKNFLDDLVDFLDDYDFKDLWRSLKGGLFGGRKQRPSSTTEIEPTENRVSAAASGPLETSVITTSSTGSTATSSETTANSATSSGNSWPWTSSTTSAPSTTISSPSVSISSEISVPSVVSNSTTSVRTITELTHFEPASVTIWPSLSTSELMFHILPWPFPTNGWETTTLTEDPFPNTTSVAVSSRTSDLPEFLFPLKVNENETSILAPNSTSSVPGPATFTDEFPVYPGFQTIGTSTTSSISTPTSSVAEPGPYIPTIRFTLPSGVPTGSIIPEIQIVPFPTPPSNPEDFINGTTTIKQTSTKVITRTLIPPTTRPRWTNGTSLPASTLTSSTLTSSTLSAPTIASSETSFGNASKVFTYSATLPSTTYIYDSAIPLREICSDPSKDTITIPLLAMFYGPNAYPALHRFPGCTSPASNSSQAIRAPGLLNCTDLGTEVQSCQRTGHKILLSVKASGVGEVGGNTEYGDPNKNPQPFGPYFGSLGRNGSIEEAVVSPRQPNLFDAYHPPSAFALTLFSLFSEGHTERADLRPLGPLELDGMSDDSPDGVKWWSKPLGEEVVVDGFDVQIPREWQGTYQEEQFIDFISRLRELTDAAWAESGSKKGGVGDLGADGKGVVYQGWI